MRKARSLQGDALLFWERECSADFVALKLQGGLRNWVNSDMVQEAQHFERRVKFAAPVTILESRGGTSLPELRILWRVKATKYSGTDFDSLVAPLPSLAAID